MSELEGLPLRYLIDQDEILTWDEDAITVVGYNFNQPLVAGIPCKYATVLDYTLEGQYGPYRTQELPNPESPGYWRNLHDQLERAQFRGYKLVAWDYMYHPALKEFEIKRVIDLTFAYGMGAFIIDPSKIAEGPLTTKLLVSHVDTLGLIDVRVDETPEYYDNLRKSVGKPDLPIWYVYSDANEVGDVSEKISSYHHMGITCSETGKFNTSIDVFPPKKKVQL